MTDIGNLGSATGAPGHATIDGQTFAVRVTYRVLGEVVNWMLKNDPAPSAIEITKGQLDGLPMELQKHMMSEAIALDSRRNQISIDEVTKFIQTPRGAAFILWIQIRETNASLTFEEVEKQIADLPAEELEEAARAVARAGGIDTMGNSTGPNSETGTGGLTDEEKEDSICV